MISAHETQFYKSISEECKVVFDVGCRDDIIFPDCEVHRFDPSPVFVDSDINNYALGSEAGELDFHYHYGSILLRDEVDKFKDCHQTVKVRVDTLDSYCEKKGISRIDLLKIDTEGWDYEVLKGSVKMTPNIKYIQFEEWSDEMVSNIMSMFSGWGVTILQSNPRNYILNNPNL